MRRSENPLGGKGVVEIVRRVKQCIVDEEAPVAVEHKEEGEDDAAQGDGEAAAGGKHSIRNGELQNGQAGIAFGTTSGRRLSIWRKPPTTATTTKSPWQHRSHTKAGG